MAIATEALSLGAPDRSPALLPGLAAELPGWRDAVEALRRAANGLGDTIPLTVVHEEATDGNVFVQDGLARLIDWGEASVSHPFVGGLLPLRVATERSGGAERLRDIYLEPFTRFAPLTELRTAFAHAYLLGTLVRALGWHAVLSPFERSVAAELGDPVAAWLEVFGGIADGTTRLGDA
jgi:Ser/Thr protein kinase RdoA (MazF antagonist)